MNWCDCDAHTSYIYTYDSTMYEYVVIGRHDIGILVYRSVT